MKTIEKQFDAVKFMRQQRDKLSEKLSKMTKVEIVEYFKKRKTETTVKPKAAQYPRYASFNKASSLIKKTIVSQIF